MADFDPNMDPLEISPGAEDGQPGESQPRDPRGLPDLSEITGLPEEPRPAPGPGYVPPFIDEVDFGPAGPRRSLETELQRRRRERRERRKRQQRDTLWNALTVIVWLAMACSVMAFVSIYTNSRSPLNIFRRPEPTLVSAVVLPSATPTLQPSPTSVVPATAVPTATATPAPPTATLEPTVAPTETVTPGPSPTATVYSLYPFVLRGEVKTISAATFADHDTCKLWVAGQVYDLQGAPMTGVTVMLGGTINYKTLTSLSLTGTALQYGPAGYEFTLADAPVKSKQSVWVMLFNQSMVPLSAKVTFDTVDDCQQNLILVNFRQVR